MDDAHRSLLECRAVALLAFAELHLRKLARGDVFNDAAHLQGSAVGIEVEFAHSKHPPLRPVSVPKNAVFLVKRLSRSHNLVGKISSHHRAVIRSEEHTS